MSFSKNNEGESEYINSISGIAISNKSILILSTIGFGILGLVLFYILRRLTDQPTDQEDNEERDYGEILNDSDVATLNRAQRRARANTSSRPSTFTRGLPRSSKFLESVIMMGCRYDGVYLNYQLSVEDEQGFYRNIINSAFQ